MAMAMSCSRALLPVPCTRNTTAAAGYLKGFPHLTRALKNNPRGPHPGTHRRSSARLRIEAKESREPGDPATDSGSSDVGVAGISAIAAGLVANPVVAWSLFTLKTTGCGLPPGPGGVVGALEGVSYLALLSIIAWSLYTKSKTGSGLPPGPFSLLGAVEGLSYLSVLAILAVFGLQYLDYGYIPSATPDERCFG